MLILSSNGITSERLFVETRKCLAIDAKRAALITTASAGYKEKDGYVLRHTEALKKLILEVECFDIEAQDPMLLHKYDVIMLLGGNPFYLLGKMRESGCRELFARLISSKTVIGVSAGSIVLGSTVGLVYELNPELNDDVGISDFTGLCLTDVNICPHLSRFRDGCDNFLERVRHFELSNNLQITQIDDGQAVFIAGDKAVLV